MADNSMTFCNTLMQLGGEDFLRELTEFMLNRIMDADVTQRIMHSLMSAVTSGRPTVTATVTVSTTPASVPRTCVYRSCAKAHTSGPSLRPAGCRRKH